MKCDASALKKDDSHAGSNPSLFKDLSGTKVLSKTHKHGRSGYPGHMTRVQQRGGGVSQYLQTAGGAAEAKTWKEKKQLFIQ